MIAQFLRKQAKIVRGIVNTYIQKRGRVYNDVEWWDSSFYTKGVSHRQTMSPDKSIITAKYHYASVEMRILKHLRNNRISMNQARVLDIGSGSGHWIDFYKSLESLEISGIDISTAAFKYLKEKYAEDSTITIYHGKALDVIEKINGRYDLVNAIEVISHIVEDFEWESTIKTIRNRLKKGGLFIVSGHFGLINGLNIHIDKDGYINKRLRSKRNWKRALKEASFAEIKIYRNDAYLWINDSLTENNVMIAIRG